MQPPRVVISGGDGKSLGQVLECARMIAPLDHISVVASAHTAPAICRVLAPWEGVQLNVQLREQRGADVLLPLAHAFAIDPLASIVFLPADIAKTKPRTLASAIHRALTKPDSIGVIGWSSAEYAAVGRITFFWDVLRASRPRDAAVLGCYLGSIGTGEEGHMLYAAYEHLENVSFDAVLTACPALEIVMLAAPVVRRPVTIPPAAARAPRGSTPNVLSGIHRVANPIADAPTMIARIPGPTDSPAARFRSDN